MDRSVAQQVLDHLIVANGALQEAVHALNGAPLAPDVSQTRHRVATLIALIGSGLYRPIYHEHPDLCPEGLRFMLERRPQPYDWPLGAPEPQGPAPGAA